MPRSLRGYEGDEGEPAAAGRPPAAGPQPPAAMKRKALAIPIRIVNWSDTSQVVVLSTREDLDGKTDIS